jgi:membrane associated rhomboid family serine protease
MLLEYWNLAPVATIIFIFTVATSIYAFYHADIFSKFMLHPYSIGKGRDYHTLLTSGLVHANWMHLFFNMFTFFFFAFPLEAMLGHWQFATIYILALILSDLPTVKRHKNNFHYSSLGASGAISAVLFSYILFKPMSIIGVMFIPMPAILFGVLYLFYCAYMSKNSRDNINHDAHFFGALTGIILTILLVPGIVAHFIGQLYNLLG